jgi:nicotinic acid mononucleotide adenylyltransferase
MEGWSSGPKNEGPQENGFTVAFEIVSGKNAQEFNRQEQTVALFPGAWNPPTSAHLEIARAARLTGRHVVWVLPRTFPHKSWDGIGIDQRLAMLRAIAVAEPGFSVALADAGLYRDIADQARAYYGETCAISIVCGRDAAERMATWDYGVEGAFEALLERYSLLVASRAGDYVPDPPFEARISRLPVNTSLDLISSSEVRRRISSGEDWAHLVPDAIVNIVRELYADKHAKHCYSSHRLP